ncbi:MAG: hypothetical protein B6U94_07100 [Thermofilum sp. ex4484_79]|nr:MAG: hypothetical protein B6U94_07100 [Thermofilum sp. ex4484_79]
MSGNYKDDIRELIDSLQSRSIIREFAIFRLDDIIYSSMPKDKARELLEKYLETEVKAIWMGKINTAFFFFKEYTVVVRPASILTMNQVNRLIEKWLARKKTREKLERVPTKEKREGVKISISKETEKEKKEERASVEQLVPAVEADKEEMLMIHEDFSRMFIDKFIEALIYLIGKDTTDDLLRKVGGKEKLIEKENFDKFLSEVEKLLGKRTTDILLKIIEI